MVILLLTIKIKVISLVKFGLEMQYSQTSLKKVLKHIGKLNSQLYTKILSLMEFGWI